MPGEFYFNNYHSASASDQAISSLKVSFEELANACQDRAETLVPVQPGYAIHVNLKTSTGTSRPRRVKP